MTLARGCLDGKILRFDLSTADVRKEPAYSYTHRFLGGRGVNHWLMLNEMKPGISPFNPDSMMVFGTGALCGTPAPASGRLNISGPNTLTGGIGSASAGGLFAPELRFAGFDNIVITGRASRPSYILINDDHVTLRDAKHIWGKNTWETQDAIRKELALDGVQTVVIGPAGENLVNLACIVASPARVAGRCGLGAVMGSKNLKAIAVKGSGRISLHDEKRFNRIADELFRKINNSKVLQRTKEFGTVKASVPTRPVKNYQDEFISPEESKDIHHEVFKAGYEREKYSCCFNCPINCGRVYEVTDGDYRGTKSRKLEANTISDFGPKLGITDPAAIIKLQSLCDQYGLDIDNTAGVIGWAMECYQRGIISKSDTDGLDLRWGNHRAVTALVSNLAHRVGFGDVLSMGCKKASEIIGRQSEKYCLHVKGQELMEAIRSPKAWALGVVVSERGGGHTRGAPLSDLKSVTSEIGERLWGVPEASDPTLYRGKAKIVLYYERFHSILDSLGICALTSNWSDPCLPDPNDYAGLLCAGTGIDFTSDDLMVIGEQIHTLGKAFNIIHAGFSRIDDYPPERFMTEAISSGPFKGQLLKKDDWDKMLDEYYALHNWDKQTGWCTRESLNRINLREVANILEKDGKLIC